MNKQQLANKIWESANKMRSKIEANEYKDYILGFIFYKFLSDKEVRYLKEQGVLSVFHYIPLHSSAAGQKFGEFRGEDAYTTRESERLMRLPLFYNLEEEQVEQVVKSVLSYPGWK